jgi:hypothetical protein
VIGLLRRLLQGAWIAGVIVMGILVRGHFCWAECFKDVVKLGSGQVDLGDEGVNAARVGGFGKSSGLTFLGCGGGDGGSPTGWLVLGDQGASSNAHGCNRLECGIDIEECDEEPDDKKRAYQ